MKPSLQPLVQTLRTLLILDHLEAHQVATRRQLIAWLGLGGVNPWALVSQSTDPARHAGLLKGVHGVNYEAVPGVLDMSWIEALDRLGDAICIPVEGDDPPVAALRARLREIIVAGCGQMTLREVVRGHAEKPKTDKAAAVCLGNYLHEEHLITHRLYRVIEDFDAGRAGKIRVVDETHGPEGHLYPVEMFAVVEVPLLVAKRMWGRRRG